MKKINFLSLLLACLFSINCNAVILKDGTEVSVRLAENVNGNMTFTGETVYFQTTEDVMVEGNVVIAKDTFVKGLVHEAVGRKSMGKGGELTLMPKSLKTVNGDLVRFEKNPLSREGRKRTGATVAHVVMWGPLGLFAKGRAAFMFRETEFDITVNGEYDLPVLSSVNEEEKSWKEFSLNFAEHKSKINYRKGKTGKDFTVYVSDSDEYNVNDLEIIAVDGHQLPNPVKPVSISSNKKNNAQKVVVFAFNDIVKYALPDSTNFVFTIGENHKSDAQLNTRWKLK